ncbi:porin, partial [Escherichia coli]|uniref:porin n=2 Tax=Escherichia coli TaxID=562 RepID=UPI00203C8DBF
RAYCLKTQPATGETYPKSDLFNKADKDLVKYADIGATYYFNKNMSTYVDYKINLLDEDDSFYAANGISTDDIVALGLVYQF